MNLEVRYYISQSKKSENPETACIFQTPFKIRRHAVSYAKKKLKDIVKNVRNWKLDDEFLEEQLKQ